MSEGGIDLSEPAEAEPIDCVVCGAWPVELRAVMREAIEAFPLHEEVCDDCVKAWWDTLPKAPPREEC